MFLLQFYNIFIINIVKDESPHSIYSIVMIYLNSNMSAYELPEDFYEVTRCYLDDEFMEKEAADLLDMPRSTFCYQILKVKTV